MLNIKVGGSDMTISAPEDLDGFKRAVKQRNRILGKLEDWEMFYHDGHGDQIYVQDEEEYALMLQELENGKSRVECTIDVSKVLQGSNDTLGGDEEEKPAQEESSKEEEASSLSDHRPEQQINEAHWYNSSDKRSEMMDQFNGSEKDAFKVNIPGEVAIDKQDELILRQVDQVQLSRSQSSSSGEEVPLDDRQNLKKQQPQPSQLMKPSRSRVSQNIKGLPEKASFINEETPGSYSIKAELELKDQAIKSLPSNELSAKKEITMEQYNRLLNVEKEYKHLLQEQLARSSVSSHAQRCNFCQSKQLLNQMPLFGILLCQSCNYNISIVPKVVPYRSQRNNSGKAKSSVLLENEVIDA